MSKSKPTHKVRLMMARCTGGAPPRDFFRITVVDELSGEVIVEIDASPHDFALAISHKDTLVDAWVGELDRIGKRQIVEKHPVGYLSAVAGRINETRAREACDRVAQELNAIRPFGWRPDYSDATNHHCSISGDRDGHVRYSVTFRGWKSVS